MTSEKDHPENPTFAQRLERVDWDIMFCAVLERLGTVAETLPPGSPQRACMTECLEALDTLRMGALQPRDPPAIMAVCTQGNRVAGG